jgi:hypothetical protein
MIASLGCASARKLIIIISYYLKSTYFEFLDGLFDIPID